MLPELAFLGYHRGSCGVNQPEKTIPRYSQISGHHVGVWFV